MEEGILRLSLYPYRDIQHVPFHIHTNISLHRYQPPVAPSIPVFQACIANAFSIAIVGFAVAFSVAKVYAIKHNYTINGNQVRSMYFVPKQLH